MYYGFDSTFIILLPALLIAAWAQYKVKSAYEKYSKINSFTGYTGAQVARMLLDNDGLYDIPIEIIKGRLTDHYDPIHRVMRLSEGVFNGTSVAAIGVAAHETGHALQHKESYFPLKFRNSIAPVVNFSSNVSWVLFILGMLVGLPILVNFGILLFSAVVVFQVVTLPVEFNASGRALKLLKNRNIIFGDEIRGAKAVLDAAALTYIAAALVAITQLARLILLSNRNRD